MLMVINGSYGGFSVPDEVCEMLGVDEYDYDDEIRMNEQFVQWVLTHEDECDDLIVVEVPDGYTDYYIEEYDGAENLLYVLDGKIHFAEEYDTEEEEDE